MTEKAFQVCREMMTARGYTINHVDTHQWILHATKPDTQHVVLYITEPKKFNVEMLKHYYTQTIKQHISHAIIVYHSSVTSSVNKILEDIDIRIELFCIDELMYNILNHELVPTHTRIRHEKKNTDKIPLIRRTDPVVRFLGFEHGDVLRIDRKDGTIYYRYVR